MRTRPKTDHAVLDASAAGRERVQKRTLIVVVVSQVLGGAGLAAGIAVGALLAEEMLGSAGLSGLPTALFTLGSALAAYLVGRYTQSHGRRIGLGLGFAAGGIGAVGVVIAAVIGSVPLLFVSLFVYGSGTATNLQARYAGTDLAAESDRGTAVSIAMVSTTLGAVAGPNLTAPLGAVASTFGITPLAGPFLLAAVAYGAAGIALFAFLRPDPFLFALSLSARAETADDTEHGSTAPGSDSDRNPASAPPGGAVRTIPVGVLVGATVMVLTQIAMVAIMTMTPVHMRAHDQSMVAVGLVIGLHVAAMFLPSPLTGKLVDVLGRMPVAIASGVTLLAAGLLAAFAPGDSLGLLTAALMLLGLGWNFGLISGTALVVDSTAPERRPRIQGTIDVFIALAGAGGGAVSGVIVAAGSFAALGIAGGLLSLMLVPVIGFARRSMGTKQPM